LMFSKSGLAPNCMVILAAVSISIGKFSDF
jgi:hypothetical protein